MKFNFEDIGDLARGAAVLGSGGGGDPLVSSLMLRQAMQKSGLGVTLIDAAALADDALVMPIAFAGSPTVGLEKIPAGTEMTQALQHMESLKGKNVDALIAAEIGGMNALLPLIVSAMTGLPVVNADGMGRAFPELQMTSFHIGGVSCSPVVMVNEHGESIVVNASDDLRVELFVRAMISACGGRALLALFPMTGSQVKHACVPGTIEVALGLGRAIRYAREESADPILATLDYLTKCSLYQHAKVLFDGRVVDIRRETSAGFSRGEVTLEANAPTARQLVIRFQNEHLMATMDGSVCAIVPDLIFMLDRETGEPITCERLKYGQRAKVLACSAPPMLRTPCALKTVGPQAFGLSQPYTPLHNAT